MEGPDLYFCYVDESGNDELLTQQHPESSPVFVLAGLTMPVARQKDIIWEFLQLKKTFRPTLAREDCSLLELIRTEVKGSDLRADIRSSKGRDRRRAAVGFIDKTLQIIERHNCRLAGRIVVKQVDVKTDERKVYTSAVAELAQTFNSQLGAAQTEGVMILDARTKTKNEGNVHTITTRKFRAGGDPLPYLVEAPVFGHSDTHVPLQIADIVASALIFPMACHAYAGDLAWSVHAHTRYADLQSRFGTRLRALEHRYIDPQGAWRGGFHTSDARNHRPSLDLFGKTA